MPDLGYNNYDGAQGRSGVPPAKRRNMAQTCISCGNDDAVIRIQTIMGPVTEDIWLCRSCADKHGIDDKEPAIEPRIADLLSGLLRQRVSKRRKKPGAPAADSADARGADASADRPADGSSNRSDNSSPAAADANKVGERSPASRSPAERPSIRRDHSFPGDDVPANGRECPSCGLTLSQLKKTGRVGCVHCYTVFRPIIETVLKEQSFAARHIGRLPERYRRYRYIFMDRERLTRDLQEAVEREDYEDAERIKGEIHRLDGQEGLSDDPK